MKIWAVANQKGGVGKTTTTVALGGLLAARGLRTLMVDLDPHGSLTGYFRYDPEALELSSYSLFEAAAQGYEPSLDGLICDTGMPGLALMPAAPGLAGLDRVSGSRRGFSLVLARALRRLPAAYDHVLIDCPPLVGVLLINALAACQRVLIPVQTEFLAIKGLERMYRTLEEITRIWPRAPDYLIVPTFFDRRTRAANEGLAVLQRRYRGHLWHGMVPVDARLPEASRAGVPPVLFDPRARGITAYGRLLEVLLEAPGPASVQQAG